MAGYSGTPLVKKLGLKEGFRVIFFDAPDHYPDLLGPIPEGIEPLSPTDGDADFIHGFYHERARLEMALPNQIEQIKRDGMIWVSWPKKSSKVPTTVTEDTIREICLPMGLVDVKVCAVDATWSGLKLVIRKELRSEQAERLAEQS